MNKFRIGIPKPVQKKKDAAKTRDSKLDEIDTHVLDELRKDSTKTIQELSQLLKVPATTVHLRKKKLENEKAIIGYRAEIDKSMLGLNVRALILVKISAKKNISSIIENIKKLPGLEEILVLSGEHGLGLKIAVRNIKELQEFLYGQKDSLQSIEGIREFIVCIILDEIK